MLAPTSLSQETSWREQTISSRGGAGAPPASAATGGSIRLSGRRRARQGASRYQDLAGRKVLDQQRRVRARGSWHVDVVGDGGGRARARRGVEDELALAAVRERARGVHRVGRIAVDEELVAALAA